MTKKLVNVKVGTPHINNSSFGQIVSIRDVVTQDFDIDLDTIISKLKEYSKEYSGEYSKLHFVAIEDCYCRYDCCCSPTYYLHGERLETDLEYNHRLSAEKARKEEQDKRDLEQFNALKKKFLDQGEIK